MTGFGRLLHAEWTKFRTVPGWLIAMLVAAGGVMALGLLPGAQGSCGQHGPESACELPVGPGGEEVTDSFTFVHQPMTGDGSITARVAELTGELPALSESDGEGQGPRTRAGVVPWAKAGLIIKDGVTPGASYAAIMVTGGHGVRMQYDFTHDLAGDPGQVSSQEPRWLRLTRSGSTVTGEESVDGVTWRAVGTAQLTGLPATAQVGLFTTSPQHTEVITGSLGSSGAAGGPSRATADFDHLSLSGSWTDQVWTGTQVGGSTNMPQVGSFEQNADTITITGSGDIAPAVAGAGGIGVSITQALVGTFLALMIAVVVGAMFVTNEYRSGMVRTSFTASPLRGRVLAAKAIVLAAATGVTGLLSAAAVVVLGQQALRSNGVYVHPAAPSTELRVIAGTAALLAVAAVLALALGTVLRRSAAAVTAGIVLIVLPYLLAMTVLPAGAAQWLLRISPAAAFAVQQSFPEYPQVANLYTPVDGYFPLPPWAGLAVLVGWTALALGLAGYQLRRRDA